MPYTIAWNEAFPVGGSAANLIWQFIQNKQVAIRERLDDVFGTGGGAASLTVVTEDYKLAVIKMGAVTTPESLIIPGATAFTIRNAADDQNNLRVLDSGDTAVRGYLTVDAAAAGTRLAATVAASTSLDLSAANAHFIVLDTNITTLNLNNPRAGGYYVLEVEQAGVGNRTIAWPASIRWSGVTPVISAGVGDKDIFSFYYNGTVFFGCVVGQAYP